MASAKGKSKTAKSRETATAIVKDRDDNVSPAKKIEELYSLVEGIDIAMLTCRTFDGTLVSRPMSTRRSVRASISGSSPARRRTRWMRFRRSPR